MQDSSGQLRQMNPAQFCIMLTGSQYVNTVQLHGAAHGVAGCLVAEFTHCCCVLCALCPQKSNQLLKAADVVSKVFERNKQWRESMIRKSQAP